MRLLILGGSGFLGPAITGTAAALGHSVTVFNNDPAGNPTGATHIRGDRHDAGDIAGLASVHWDGVVDTWQGQPDCVEMSAQALSDVSAGYTYISSLTVYRDAAPPPLTEQSPLRDPATGAKAPYADRKAAAEQAVLRAFPNRSLIIRTGLLLGPRDTAARLAWWLDRLCTRRRVLVPGPQDRRLQYVDVRDLADWLISMVSLAAFGTYNVTCPPGHATMAAVLTACAQAVRSKAELCWAAPELLIEAGLSAWTDLPLWIPEVPGVADVYNVDPVAAIEQGMAFRSITDTVAATVTWWGSIEETERRARLQRRPWLTPEAEDRILRRLPVATLTHPRS